MELFLIHIKSTKNFKFIPIRWKILSEVPNYLELEL